MLVQSIDCFFFFLFFEINKLRYFLSHRLASKVGGRTLSTSSGRFCDKQNNVASSNLEEKTNVDKQTGLTEAHVETDHTTLNASKVVANQDVELGNSGTIDGSAPQQEEVVNIEQLKVMPKQVKSNMAKSGKESLLDLLGAMKVEVTNKRKLPNVRFKQSHQSMSRSKPAMDSTINMFQQATAEASSKR